MYLHVVLMQNHTCEKLRKVLLSFSFLAQVGKYDVLYHKNKQTNKQSKIIIIYIQSSIKAH